MVRFLLIVFCLHFPLEGDENTSTFNETIDNSYKIISDKVIELSDYIDDSLYNFPSQSHTSSVTEEKRDKIDTFFQNDRFFEDRDETYIRINTNYLLQSKTKERSRVGASARVPLSKTKKRFLLFIRDMNDGRDSRDSVQGIGVDYFAPKTYGINSRYSVGIRSFYPYVRARYNTMYEIAKWVIEPVQSFRYSTKTHFQEDTSLFFDRKISKISLFRIQLHRGTKEDKKGMDYNIYLSHITLSKKFGLNFVQAFSGNTKYQDIQHPEQFSGIYNYSSSLSFRKNIWKPWFFYEVAPAVNFHRQYDYEPNYSLRFTIDLYFGKYTGL